MYFGSDKYYNDNRKYDSRKYDNEKYDSKKYDNRKYDSRKYDNQNEQDIIFELAMALSNKNEELAIHKLNKPKNVYKYQMALGLAENDIKTAKDIMDYLDTIKAKKLGLTKAQYLQKKKKYKIEKEAMKKQIHAQHRKFEMQQKQLVAKYKKGGNKKSTNKNSSNKN